MQIEYGRVLLYSETLGERPLSQTQEYVRTSGLHSFEEVVPVEEPWSRQIRGHWVVCCSHQKSVVGGRCQFGVVCYVSMIGMNEMGEDVPRVVLDTD